MAPASDRISDVTRIKTVVTVISKISDRPLSERAALVVIYGSDLGKRIELDRPAFLVGRSSKCDVQVDQASVSRAHARIEMGETGFRVVDLGSTNGTFVNDVAVNDRVLNDGDFIKIGRTIFKFLGGANIESEYHETIYRLTTVDGLTGAHNKRYFVEALDRELSRCRRYRRDLSLVMFDMDKFKDVNDQYGHLAGDYVLKTTCEIIQEHIRREDILARYGGEEFAAVLPEINLAGATKFAEKLRHLVENHPFRFDGAAIPVTLSLGVTQLGDPVTEPDEFIDIADRCLYAAKEGGRNRVVAAMPDHPPPPRT